VGLFFGLVDAFGRRQWLSVFRKKRDFPESFTRTFWAGIVLPPSVDFPAVFTNSTAETCRKDAGKKPFPSRYGSWNERLG